MPRNKHNKGKVRRHKVKIQEILDTLDSPGSPLDGTLLVDFPDAVTTAMSENGALSALPLPTSYRVLIISPFSTSISQLAGV